MMKHYLHSSLVLLCILVPVYSELPSDLPGEEITQEYMQWALPKDTIIPQVDNISITTTWYDKAAKTWDAPPLAEQMSADPSNIPLGKGGIFVPKFSEFYRAPDIEILDPNGETVLTGEIGKTFSVEPGTYFVVLGSGSQRQRMTRQVTVEESKVTPALPDWCGLTIETVDTNANAFRGEYELVRIDEFEPYGRGFGANPADGEALSTWILKPGIYKIFGRGQSFNTLRNFVTIRLIAGEYSKLLLVQRTDDYAILGGGTVDLTPGTKIKSLWRYGANIGGALNLSLNIDRTTKNNNTMNSNLDLRSDFRLSYNNTPFEWQTDLSLIEGINVSDFITKFDFKDLITASDDIRLTSLLIWRLLTWFGPYGRTELSTNLFPSRIKRDDTKYKEFLIINSDSITSVDTWDSSGTTKLTSSFSPFNFEIGGGANFDAVRTRILETKIRLGIVYSVSNFKERFENIDTNDIKFDRQDSLLLYRIDKALIIQKKKNIIVTEFGPQLSMNLNLHVGRFATAGAELKIFTPIVPENRLTRPDFDLITTVSWRLSRYVTLDYDFNYVLKQPEDRNAQVDFSTHKLWLRFSYSGR